MSELPKVSIVVVTYKEESKRYLDACMRSIAELNYPKELLDVVLVGRPDYAPKYDGVLTVYPREHTFGTEKAQNLGISFTDKESKHLLVCNDDVILTANCLTALVEAAADEHVLLMPISPCDNYWKYQLQFVVPHEGGHVQLTDRFYTYEQLEPYLPSLMRADSVYPPGAIVTDMLCTFVVLVPRKTYERIGPFDEGFDTGQSDYDYCMRARDLGIARAIVLNSLVWHFGGATSTSTLTDKRKSANARYYRKKWGVWPEGFDMNTLSDPSEAELREMGFIGE